MYANLLLLSACSTHPKENKAKIVQFDDNMEIGARGNFINTSGVTITAIDSSSRHSIVLRSGDNSHEIRLTFNDETRITKASYFYATKVLCRSDTREGKAN